MGISRKRLRIGGMSCIHCQEKIESALRETTGVHKAEVSYRSRIAEIIYDPDMVAPEELQTVIERLDYTVMPETAGPAPDTYQICYGSGRGYYVQSGNTLVCQNCGNRFTVDQVEVQSGGCNPWPIFPENKTVTQEIIEISYDFLLECKGLFANWKKGTEKHTGAPGEAARRLPFFQLKETRASAIVIIWKKRMGKGGTDMAGPKNILVVDYEPMIQEAVASYLEKQGASAGPLPCGCFLPFVCRLPVSWEKPLTFLLPLSTM